MVARYLGSDGALDLAPEALPVVAGRESPGKIEPKKPQQIGPRSVWNGEEAQTQPRQVLDPPAAGQGVPEVNSYQIDQAEPVNLTAGPDVQEDVRGLQVAV